MIHSSTSFISVDQVPSKKVNMVQFGGGIGIANAGGTSLCKFAEDGDTSYLDRRPTWVFALFALAAHP